MTIYFASDKPNLKPIAVPQDSAVETSLMQLLLEAKLPVASSCNGDGICSKCRVQVISGRENLSTESVLETKTKIRNKIGDSERLSCQVHITGDIKIDTNYW